VQNCRDIEAVLVQGRGLADCSASNGSSAIPDGTAPVIIGGDLAGGGWPPAARLHYVIFGHESLGTIIDRNILTFSHRGQPIDGVARLCAPFVGADLADALEDLDC
jgi:hypothetical protein